MQEEPGPVEILASVSAFLRDVAVPELSGHASFTARVAANAVDLVAREIALRGAADAGEKARLERLLGETGPLDVLNRRLAEAIRAGRFADDDPALIDHLMQTTMDKLAIDQPAYASYRAELARAQGSKGDAA
jgi:voltage-gated potassium channel Kch